MQKIYGTQIYSQLLYRSPRVIRENYLLKLGVNPSPQLSVRGGRTAGAPGSPYTTTVNNVSGPLSSNTNNQSKYPFLPKRSLSINGEPKTAAQTLEEGRSNSGGYQNNL